MQALHPEREGELARAHALILHGAALVAPVEPTATPAPTPPAVPLPEAPASVNVHLTIGGRDVQLTLRDTDEGRLLQRLQTILERYPVPQPGPPAPGTDSAARVLPTASGPDEADHEGGPQLVQPQGGRPVVQGALGASRKVYTGGLSAPTREEERE
jgi:hypothetical protein